MYVIGDIAGQFAALQKLVDSLPDKERKIVLLGDLNDRGWESKQVIQWAIDNDVANGGRVTTLDSNHGDLLIDWFYQKTNQRGYSPRYEGYDIFEYNGGRPTMTSYGHDIVKCTANELLDNETLVSHIQWLQKRPTHLLTEANGQKFLLTHAPMNPSIHRSFEQFLIKGGGFVHYDHDSRQNYQWNRYEPFSFHQDLPNTISVFGHNSGQHPKLICKQYRNGIYLSGWNDEFKELLDLNKGEVYGIGIDTSFGKYLTALDLDNMLLYKQEYI